MQHRGKMLSPGTAGGEQVCQLMQFNSRKVQKEETISHFYSEEGAWGPLLDILALPCLSDDNTRPVSGFTGDRGERQASLCVGALAAPEPHFTWAKVHVCWGCTSLFPTVGAASPPISVLPIHSHPWAFLVLSSHIFIVEVQLLSLGNLISPQLQYLLLLFLKYSLLPSLLHYLLHHSPLLPLICLSLLLPWAGEEDVAGIGILGFFCRTPALPASWTYSFPFS